MALVFKTRDNEYACPSQEVFNRMPETMQIADDLSVFVLGYLPTSQKSLDLLAETLKDFDCEPSYGLRILKKLLIVWKGLKESK